MDNKGLWQAVLGELEVSLSRANFSTWFKNTGILGTQDGHIVVAVPNIFTKKWLEEKYQKDIQEALSKVHGEVKSVEFKVGDMGSEAAKGATTTATASDAAPQVGSPTKSQGASDNAFLNSRYTFNNFVVGSSNELAYAACQAVAKYPGDKYNPLFLYGGVGLGKTHLMQAVGNEIIKRNPNARVEYITSEGFTTAFVSSISRKKTGDFSGRFRGVDVLIIDDVQFFESKEKTQDEFFHTFNALHQANKQIILSCDRPPQAISGLEQRLLSRFSWGMTADIQPPDLETRSAILQSKAATHGVAVPSDVIEYLAANIKSNVRELEGALTQLIAHCELQGEEPNISAASGLLGHLSAKRARSGRLTARAVVEKVAGYYDLRPEDLTGPKRDKEIVVPRQIAMHIMRHELNLSFPKIAGALGGRDHTTAIHSVSKIDRQLETDETLRAEVGALRERIGF